MRIPTMPTLKTKILRERARFYAFRVLPSGKTVRLTPFGRKVFGTIGLAWLKRRAKRLGWKIIVKRMAPTKADKLAAARSKGLAAMRWALSIEPSFHYRQSRPFNVNAILRRLRSITTDCSASTVMLYKAAGLPDPTGNAYDGGRTKPTYTGTLRTGSPRKRLSDCKPLDYIVYGTGTGRHVVVVFKPHPTDPLVFSHGQESGPRLYRHSVQVAVHGNYFTCHGPR